MAKEKQRIVILHPMVLVVVHAAITVLCFVLLC